MRRFFVNYSNKQTLSVKLSWSHYCELLNVSDKNAREFYEIDEYVGGVRHQEAVRLDIDSLIKTW